MPDQVTDTTMVQTLINERLATEPRTARTADTDVMFANALAWMRATLIAVVAASRSDGRTEPEIDTMVRGALSQLLRDDLLTEDQLRAHAVRGQVW